MLHMIVKNIIKHSAKQVVKNKIKDFATDNKDNKNNKNNKNKDTK